MIGQMRSENLEVKIVKRGAGVGGSGLYARKGYEKGEYIIVLSGELFRNEEVRSVDEDR